MARWRRDHGDQRLRLAYPLTRESVVWDLGGYQGDFAASVHERYGSKVVVFEPVPSFFRHCSDRFLGMPDIRCLPFGLGAHNGRLQISQDSDASSFVRTSRSGGEGLSAEIRAVPEVWEELATRCVDLMKINIEGGEYDVLESLLSAGLIGQVKHLQVQFHDFVADAVKMRDSLRQRLSHTHRQDWCYEFVWESWSVRF
jgi:FkbM family methyltransferase